jgi:hypothetical protein
MQTTVSWVTGQGELVRGRTQILTTNVTTDHATSGPSFPPPGPPPARGPRGGGDDHLPGRLQILLARGITLTGVLLAATAIAGALWELTHHRAPA